MKSCVFRCLTENDYDILTRQKFIPCGLGDDHNGKYPYPCEKLMNALDCVNRHLKNGSKFYSPWISCSKSFITDVEKYTLSTKDYETSYRPYIAVIRNHRGFELKHNYSEDELIQIMNNLTDKTLANLFRNLQVNRINKLVLNVSDTETMLNFFNCGALRNYDGSRSVGGAMALNFAKASEEVLVFRSIPTIPDNIKRGFSLADQFNIPVILSPLAYDVLYSLIKSGSITEDENYKTMFLINLFVNNRDNFMNLLTDNEKDFYIIHYSSRNQIRTILKSINSKVIDYESLFFELIKLKMSILRKVIIRYNEINNTNYCTEPYIFSDRDEMIENNINCDDVNLGLLRSKLLIKSRKNN